MSEQHAENDEAAVTPSVDTGAVGRVGGSDDETFAREDGAEVRGSADAGAEEPTESDDPTESEEPDGPHTPPRDVLG